MRSLQSLPIQNTNPALTGLMCIHGRKYSKKSIKQHNDIMILQMSGAKYARLFAPLEATTKSLWHGLSFCRPNPSTAPLFVEVSN